MQTVGECVAFCIRLRASSDSRPIVTSKAKYYYYYYYYHHHHPCYHLYAGDLQLNKH